MSEAAANEFLAKVSQEKLWKYIELKTCLVKDSEDIWKVAFLNLQLLSESTTSGKTINVDNNLLLVHKILRISTLSRLLEQITGGLYGIGVSLDANEFGCTFHLVFCGNCMN